MTYSLFEYVREQGRELVVSDEPPLTDEPAIQVSISVMLVSLVHCSCFREGEDRPLPNQARKGRKCLVRLPNDGELEEQVRYSIRYTSLASPPPPDSPLLVEGVHGEMPRGWNWVDVVKVQEPVHTIPSHKLTLSFPPSLSLSLPPSLSM